MEDNSFQGYRCSSSSKGKPRETKVLREVLGANGRLRRMVGRYFSESSTLMKHLTAHGLFSHGNLSDSV